MKTEICAYCRHEVPVDSYCAVCGAPLIKTQRDLEGCQIQSYLVGSLVGEGASGRLYRAHHIATHREVALKLLQPELATNPKSIRRFRREAEVGIRLQHPHAVKLFEFGIDKESGIFMVMELIQGKSLQARLREEIRLSPERALTIALQMCAVLEKAHSLQIIHRDLKPANILMQTHPGDCDFAKVCDFGLAKMELPSTDETHLTVPGTIYGTPGYMAPEQCLGEPSDARTDIYALGVTLYEMLSGRLPFAGTTPLELIMRPLQTEPLMLRRSFRGLQHFAAIDFLEATVMKCLKRDPKDRYSSAQMLKLDLQMCLPSSQTTELNLIPTGMFYTPPPPTAFPWRPICLTDEQLNYSRTLMHDVPIQSWQPAQALFQKDQMPSRFYLIKSGEVRILDQNEQRIVELDRLGPGDFVGVASFFSHSSYALTAEATTTSEIHVIDRHVFTAWIQGDARLQSLFHHFFREFLQQEVMRYSPFFAPIPPEQRSEFIKSCYLQPVGRGKDILKQGEMGDALYIVASGQIEVYWPNDEQENAFHTQHLKEGEFFGELSLLSNHPISASVRAVSNAILLRLPKQRLLQLTQQYPAIHKLINQVANERIQENKFSSISDLETTIPV